MKVLGISDHFTAGAAVIIDGHVVAAVNEERLARKKMVMGFPRKSIAAVLEIAGLRPEELDRVAVASKWGHFLNEYVELTNGVLAVDEGIVKNLFFSMGSRLSFLRSRLPIAERLYYDLRRPVFAQRRRKIAAVLKNEFGIACPIEYVSHHHAHAACSYYASGFDDALLVTLDGAGDGHSSHVYEVSAGQWRHLCTVPSFDSVGDYYAYVTHICGFKAGKHEGKITGLAAYGKPKYRDVFDKFIRYENGSMRNIGNCFRFAAIDNLLEALPRDYTKEDLAATIQDVTEEIACNYVRYWARQTGKRNVGLAGGVFANVKVNQRIHELEEVDSVFVYPAMSDEGLAAGAAMLTWCGLNGNGRLSGWKCFDHVYLGPEFSETQIAQELQAEGIDFSTPADLEQEVARLISQGHVVARFDGRMEYGPRALGNRSILYRPDEPSVNDWLNKRLGRTEFMPFAPAVLAEDADRYFLNLEGARETARFMTITFDCNSLMKKTCPGVVHVDGTARPQLVSPSDNPRYYQILKEFKRLTGLSCFVNTSFNMHEEPIVCTPKDAIRAFKRGHLDFLAIGRFLAKNQEKEVSEGVREGAGIASTGV
ncbi:MAG TPA: carbamoyltransferase C-terminal domain-containing protein [Acidobacteriota bacterium]|nr:carbamoyltransferase C-terminal domain-containing protein [Acidobacteriota bacterium]